MIKKFLLASGLLSLAFASNAAETEYYVIKDGKMVNCEFVKSSEPVEESYEVEESANKAGDAMVKIKNPAEAYKSAFLYLKEAVDLSKAWNLELEYYFEEDMEINGNCAKRECWRFDLMADTMPCGKAVWETDPKQSAYRIAHVSIDARSRDFYSCVDGKAVLDNHGLGKLRKVTKYVYSSPMMPAAVAERGDGNMVKAIFLAMFPESAIELTGYIKTLKFVSDGTKPFYADKMTVLSNEATIHAGGISNFVYAQYNDTKVGAMEEPESIEKPTKMYGQQLFASLNGDGLANSIQGDRMYCDNGEQGVVDFYDSEYGFLPYMTAGHKADADAILRIPFGIGAVDKKINIAMRLGHNAGETGKYIPYEDYIETSKDIRFPVEYRFESGDAQTITNPTEWTKFRPTYTKGGDDYVDSIPTMMQMVYGDVEVPSGEYSYITLRFVPNDVISYMFGDIRLTGDTNWWPRRIGDYTLGKDYKKNNIPVSFRDNVENVIAKGEVSIYPNPASDVITVTNEGVKSVEVYTVAGVLVASSDSNVVSVANLANGIYVVKANTEAGVVTGQIIKK